MSDIEIFFDITLKLNLKPKYFKNLMTILLYDFFHHMDKKKHIF